MNDTEATETTPKMKRKQYENELRKLQTELCRLQEWVKLKGLRVIVVFEGRDAAGKGGTIKAITERVSPRVFRLVALPAPSDREKTQMYMQRYMQHFPAAGEVVIFDRSWYNRAGVERVMGFCSEEEYGVSWKTARLSKSTSSTAGSSSSSSGLKWVRRNKSGGSRPASRTRCVNGNSVRWTSNHMPVGTTIRVPATRCSKRPTPSTRRGISCDRTTRNGPG